MKRREFIAGLGSAAAWPLTARAQQGNRMRRIGVLMAFDENDLEGKADLSEFTQGLAELGWTDGSSLRVNVGWAVRPRTAEHHESGLTKWPIVHGVANTRGASSQRKLRAAGERKTACCRRFARCRYLLA